MQFLTSFLNFSGGGLSRATGTRRIFRHLGGVCFSCAPTVCSVVAAHGATALLGNERRHALPLIDAFARTFHVPYVSVTSSPPNAAAVMATRDAASAAGDEDRAFVLYIRPSFRRAMVDVVRAYHWTRIYYIYTDPEGWLDRVYVDKI